MAWLHLADVADLAERRVVGRSIGERGIAIYRLADGIYATTDVCPHQSACLSGGEVVDGYIECPAHFALFDIRSGKAEGGLATHDLTTYPVDVQDGKIFVLVE
jgi:nitrite reductase/ring-hydroxylating ferredoxin subunit